MFVCAVAAMATTALASADFRYDILTVARVNARVPRPLTPFAL